MKKALKIFLCIVTVITICFSLTGCNLLEDAREAHAFWKDGNIVLGNSEYIVLPPCETLRPDYSELTEIYVTEPDVPVLLSMFLGTPLTKSNDGVFLVDDSYTLEDDVIFYCRSDKYDEIIDRINEGFKPTGYCYEYTEYNDDYDYEWQPRTYILSDLEKKAVDSVVAKVKPTVLPEIANTEYEYAVYLDECSQDMLFKKSSYEIYLNKNIYYIYEYKESKAYLYTVPSEYNASFESLMSKSIESEKQWEDEFLDEDFFEAESDISEF